MLNSNFIDLVNIMDLAINISNLRSNTAQEERQKLEEAFNKRLNAVLEEIHSHLQNQDNKIDAIMEKLEVKTNGG